MSSDEMKKQLLTQKLLRNFKNKQKLSKNSEIATRKYSDNKSKSSNSGKNKPHEKREISEDLTRRAIGNQHNERTKQQHATKSKRKFEELSKRPPKFGTRMHSFQSTEERLTKQKETKS